MNRRIDPLSPEERDLAERLARLGGPREPAPALDAAILAAAHAEVAGDEVPAAVAPVSPVADPTPQPGTPPDQASPKVTPFRPKRTVPRWPLGLSVAATVVLAAGIGWKLQGDGEGSSAESAKVMAPAAASAAEEEAVLLDPALDRAPVQPPPPPPPLEKDEVPQLRRVAADTVTHQTMAKPAPRADNDGFVADAAPIAEAPAAAAPMPSAPPAREQPVVVDRQSRGVIDVSGNQVPRTAIGQADDRAVGAAEYTRTPLDQRREESRANRLAQPAAAPAAPPPPIEQDMQSPRDRARRAAGAGTASGGYTAGNVSGFTSGTGAADKVAADKPVAAEAAAAKAASGERYDERPPVSADSPAFRQSWLQRIRTLLAAGDTAAAAESLQEFRRRYPSVELPEDLRKFAATLPPPAPSPTP